MTLIGLCIAWVLAATAVAFLPLRFQYVPGIALLIGAGVLIWLLAGDYGLLPAALGLLAVISMFRKPLRYFALRAMGQTPEVPK
ncbi:DUF2484 family protein [Roseovarius sp. 2305UL8-3]|uniref:DUF2484 family protein n=1 Tax=Roseovarius conchicola TaxID=3121636 RepID=UPI003527A8D6